MKGIVGWIVAIVGAVALGAAGWWLTHSGAAEEGEGPAFAFVLPVTLGEVELRDVRPRARLTGTVRSARRANLAFDAAGLVEAIDADEGEAVTEGHVLARLGCRDEELEIAAAKAALASTQRELALLQAGERAEEIRRLEAELEAARAATELAKLEVERGKKLLEEAVISRAEQDVRETAYRAANRKEAAAFELHSKAVAGTRPEDLAISEARVAEAEARVSTTEHDLAKTRLVAPWAGTVTRRDLSPGDYASAGASVFEIVDVDHLEVHVEVPGRYASRIGESAEVILSLADREEFSLRTALDTTIPAADELSRSFRAIVRLEAGEVPAGILRPGDYVRVELLLETFPQALTVPSDCVLVGEHGAVVVRAAPAPPPEGGGSPGPPPPTLVAEFVPVRVLAQADGYTAVEPLGPPLSPGDSIVLAGADNAYPGAALSAGPSGPPPPSPAPGGPPAEDGE